MVEHHFVILAAEARLFVAAERGVCRVIVVAIYPDAAGLDGTRDLVELVSVARPDTRSEAVERVVGYLDSVGFVLERCYGSNRAEYLFLEDTHLVVAFEKRRFDVESVFETVRILMGLATAQNLGTSSLPIWM